MYKEFTIFHCLGIAAPFPYILHKDELQTGTQSLQKKRFSTVLRTGSCQRRGFFFRGLGRGTDRTHSGNSLANNLVHAPFLTLLEPKKCMQTAWQKIKQPNTARQRTGLFKRNAYFGSLRKHPECSKGSCEHPIPPNKREKLQHDQIKTGTFVHSVFAPTPFCFCPQR